MKDSELQRLIREVENEIKATINADKGLRKDDVAAFDDAPPPGAEGSAPDAGVGGGDPGLAPGDAPPPGGDIAGDDGGGGDLDPQALQAEYSQLPPEELKIHYMAAKAALFELMGGGAGGGAPAGAGGPPPDAAAGPGPGAGAPAGAPPPAAGPGPGPEESALKAEIRKNEARFENMEKNFAKVTQALELMVGAPVRKAVTGIPALNKSEKKLSKEEQMKAVNDRLRKPGLSKSETDSLLSFSLGNKSFDDIKGIVGK